MNPYRGTGVEDGIKAGGGSSGAFGRWMPSADVGVPTFRAGGEAGISVTVVPGVIRPHASRNIRVVQAPAAIQIWFLLFIANCLSLLL